MRKFVGLVLIVAFILTTLQSCGFGEEEQRNSIPVISTVGDVITKQYDIYYETKPESLNYTNPKENKYLGAYIENNVYKSDIFTFEQEMGEHSMYVFDLNLNELDPELLKLIVENCMLNGAVPYIILTSNSVIYDMKIEDIEAVMDVLKDYDYPMVLELLPYQVAHNYNVDLYKLFYIQAYELIKKENSKVDVAYPINMSEYEKNKEYTPSSKYFDYLSIRLDVDVEMTTAKMMYLFEEAYQSHLNKPKVLNVAISHYDPETKVYYDEDAFEKLNKLYTKVESGYENLVAVNYMDYTYNDNMGKPYNQRYTLNGIPKIAEEYKLITSQDGFLKKISFAYDDKCVTKFVEQGVKVEDKVYLPNSVQNYFGTKIKVKKINDGDYVELSLFVKELNDKKYYLILDEENGRINCVGSWAYAVIIM